MVGKNAVAQWMWLAVTVLDNNVNNIEMIEHDAIRSVCFLSCCVFAESESGHDSGHDRGVVDITIERAAVRAIIHGLEHYLQFNGLRSYRLRDWVDWDQCGVVGHVVVLHGP